uniref:Uncharacterized protein n=1 Tax=Rhizophora mucronata TaxID=61149 RepID=A0A2P2PWE0_RHIMU
MWKKKNEIWRALLLIYCYKIRARLEHEKGLHYLLFAIPLNVIFRIPLNQGDSFKG